MDNLHEDSPLKSIIFRCLLFIPTTRHLGSFRNQASECAVSETPASAIGLTDSTWVLLWWCDPDGLFKTSHNRTEWSVLYLSSPDTIRFGSTGFHATALHCLACLGAVGKVERSKCDQLYLNIWIISDFSDIQTLIDLDTRGSAVQNVHQYRTQFNKLPSSLPVSPSASNAVAPNVVSTTFPFACPTASKISGSGCV